MPLYLAPAASRLERPHVLSAWRISLAPAARSGSQQNVPHVPERVLAFQHTPVFRTWQCSRMGPHKPPRDAPKTGVFQNSQHCFGTGGVLRTSSVLKTLLSQKGPVF
eukprot:4262623-Prymnesium_polylepis.2